MSLEAVEKKLIDTVEYRSLHLSISSIRNSFYLLNGEHYDGALYDVLEKIQQCHKTMGKSQGDAISTAKTTDVLVAALNQDYQTIIQHEKISSRQIKKLRSALYRFSIENEISLASLVGDNTQVLAHKKIAKLEAKNSSKAEVENEKITHDDAYYEKLHNEVRVVFEAIRDNPVRIGLRKRFFDLRRNLFGLVKTMDQDVFNIMQHLADLRLDQESMALANDFLSATEGRDAKTKLVQFLNQLYAVFNALSIDCDMIRSEDLKKLKKLIHDFAEKNGFEKKLFNLKKLYQKKLEDDFVSEKLKAHPNRSYAYHHHLVNETTEKKLINRRKKKRINYTSLAITLVIALGEGLIASVFGQGLVAAALAAIGIGGGAAALPLIVSLFVIGIPAFAVTYYLFRKDSSETLKQFFISGIFRDQNGDEISSAKKVAINITLVSSVAAATVFGVFTFSSSMTALTALAGVFAIASIGMPPLIAVSAVLAAVAIIANISLFYFIMADFIKNDRIQQIGRFFKESFYGVWKMPDWEEKTQAAKVGHYFKAAGLCLFNGLFLGLGLAGCGLITAATLGLGHTHAVGILTQMTNFAPKIVDLLAVGTVYFLSGPMNGFLYSKGVITVTNAIKSTISSIFNAVMHPITTAKSLSENWEQFKSNRLRSTGLVFSFLNRAVLFAATLANGVGMGGGPLGDAKSISNVATITGLPEAVSAGTGGLVSGAGSVGVNGGAIHAATKQPEPIKLLPPLDLVSSGKTEVTPESEPELATSSFMEGNPPALSGQRVFTKNDSLTFFGALRGYTDSAPSKKAEIADALHGETFRRVLSA